MNNKTLFTLLLSVFIAVLGIGNILPVLPMYISSLGANGIQLAIIIAAFSISRAFLQPVVGSMSDTMGRKRFLLAGLLIYAVVGLLIPESKTITELVFIRVLHGVGSAMIVPVAMGYVSLLTPVGYEGRYMSYLNMAIFTGMGCGPIIGGFFYDHYGFESVFYSMAIMSFIAILLVIFYLPSKEEVAAKKTSINILASMGKMIKSQRTLGILISRYATMLIMVPSMGFLPILMTDNFHGVSVTTIGMIIACRTLVNAACQIPFGKLADKKKKICLLATGSIIIIAGLLIIPSAMVLWQVFILYALLGTGEAMVWAALGAFATEEGRNIYGHGTMMGVISLAMSAGVLTGSILAGLGMDMIGISWAFYLPAISIGILTTIGISMITAANKAQSQANL